MSLTPAPAPEVKDVVAWLASDLPALKQQAYAGLVHPQFPVAQVSDQICALAVSANTQERHIAAVAMGKDRSFAPKLAQMLNTNDHTVVRTATAHSLFRVQSCPDEAIPPLASMLVSTQEAERKIAEVTLRLGPTYRLEHIAKTIRDVPEDTLSHEALSALATAAQSSPGAEDSVSAWLLQLAGKTSLPIPVRLAILAALARVSRGKKGCLELLQVVERGADAPQRKLAIATLGTLGELGAPCWPDLARVLESERDEECEAAMYRLLVELRTPEEYLPAQFLFHRIMTSSAQAIFSGACMVISMGGAAFAKYAEYLVSRHARVEEPLSSLLSACHEKLTGNPIV